MLPPTLIFMILTAGGRRRDTGQFSLAAGQEPAPDKWVALRPVDFCSRPFRGQEQRLGPRHELQEVSERPGREKKKRRDGNIHRMPSSLRLRGRSRPALVLAEFTVPVLPRLRLRVPLRDENDRKRSIEGQITFVFTSFSRKRNRYDIVGNEYGAGNFENDSSRSENTSITIGIHENGI
jgi:hypothetical protein